MEDEESLKHSTYITHSTGVKITSIPSFKSINKQQRALDISLHRLKVEERHKSFPKKPPVHKQMQNRKQKQQKSKKSKRSNKRNQ